jgi:type I restriction enzyme, S subunit
MELKPGYKQTEVGVIPEDWDCVSIQSAASNASNAIVGGPFGSDLTSSDYVYSGVPVVRGANMGSKMIGGSFVFVSTSKASALAANLARPQDLVFTQRGTLGQVSLVPDELFESYLISQSQMKVSLDGARYVSEYVYHYFSSAPGQKQILDSAIQTGVPHTNLGICRKYVFPAPCITEQEKICDVLNDIDSHLELIGRLLDKKKQIKQAAMQELLTGKRRLPGFAGEWEEVSLGSVAMMNSGGTPPTGRNDFYGGGIPWVSISDMTSGGRFISETERTLSDLGLLNCAAKRFPAGTILYAMYASLGECSVATCEVTTSQAILGIRPSPSLIREYLYYYLCSIHGMVKQLGQQGTQSNLNKKIVQGFTIKLPKQTEQIAIANILSDIDQDIDMLNIKAEKARAMKTGMMQQLLTGKIRLK